LFEPAPFFEPFAEQPVSPTATASPTTTASLGHRGDDNIKVPSENVITADRPNSPVVGTRKV
jgi:hypothetical protein